MKLIYQQLNVLNFLFWYLETRYSSAIGSAYKYHKLHYSSRNSSSKSHILPRPA